MVVGVGHGGRAGEVVPLFGAAQAAAVGVDAHGPLVQTTAWREEERERERDRECGALTSLILIRTFTTLTLKLAVT